MAKYFVLLFVALMLMDADAYANVDCTENVVAVIVHSDGAVYFQTDQTCSGVWCQLNWTSASSVNQAYAMLLAAKARGVPLIFDWATITSCAQFNVFAASPGYVADAQ
jgi:hypothetical protein